MTVTVAPGITEPDWSETVPVIRPSSACGNAGTQISDSARIAERTWIAFLAEADNTFSVELINPPLEFRTHRNSVYQLVSEFRTHRNSIHRLKKVRAP